MNKGLVVGKVMRSNGEAVEDAEVWIGRVMTGGGLLYINGQDRMKFATSTDSKGKYGLPFPWNGADIGDVMNSLSILVVAAKDLRTGNNDYSQGGRITVKGYLVKDIKGLMGVAVSDPAQAVKDGDAAALIEFGKDMIQSYRKFADYPIYKTGLSTTENWMILAGANIYLRD
jgi:hypothetical protein